MAGIVIHTALDPIIGNLLASGGISGLLLLVGMLLGRYEVFRKRGFEQYEPSVLREMGVRTISHRVAFTSWLSTWTVFVAALQVSALRGLAL